MWKVLLATNNRNKITEFRSLIRIPGLILVSPDDIGLQLDVLETGTTYLENASLKAKAFAHASGILSLADDSGLEVDALGGLPGLHSKRFGMEPEATDSDRRKRLLSLLHGYPQPWTARFRCVIAIASPDGKLQSCEGECPGVVIPQERGNNGFGYDPIFMLPHRQKTMAELSLEEKNMISHRARACLAAIPLLESYLSV